MKEKAGHVMSLIDDREVNYSLGVKYMRHSLNRSKDLTVKDKVLIMAAWMEAEVNYIKKYIIYNSNLSIPTQTYDSGTLYELHKCLRVQYDPLMAEKMFSIVSSNE